MQTDESHLCKRLLILLVLEGVYERIDDRWRPSQDRRQDVEEGVSDIVVDNVHQHQREEADLKVLLSIKIEIFKFLNIIYINLFVKLKKDPETH